MTSKQQLNPLAREFRLPALLRFALPTTAMTVFNALYSVVDGAFVSTFVSTDALASVNIILPVYSVLWGLGAMLATGGSALIARKMGEGKAEESRRNFSCIAIAACVLGLLVGSIVICFMDSIVMALGADETILPYAREYLGIIIVFAPAVLLQIVFQNLFVAAGKPHLGLAATVCAGLINVLLDFVFIVVFGWGIAGAALATGIGYCIPTAAGLIFFSLRRGALFYAKPFITIKEMAFCCYNGASEMIQEMSIGVSTFLFNITMMGFAGADGVAAITILLYLQSLFLNLSIGFAMGVSPIASYRFGARDTNGLRQLVKRCLLCIGSISVIAYITSAASAAAIIQIFAPVDSEVYTIALGGFRIYVVSLLFAGVNVYISALFTALSNGKISALLSLLRTLILISGFLLVLPNYLGLFGVWLALPLAELVAFAISWIMHGVHRKKYFEASAV